MMDRIIPWSSSCFSFRRLGCLTQYFFVFVYTTGNFNSYDEYGIHLKSS